MMDKLESPCGCRIEILCSEKRPKTACRWMQSVSIVELGKVSTPCSSLKIQNDSPVHMDTPLMLRSSSCESIPVQKGWSVKTEAFDDSMENGCENQLLTFTLDSSNLSWSSSMATPRDMAFKKFPVDAERQKGPARALFSPTSCGGDSELDDASLDLTVEQEEQSISLVCIEEPDTSEHTLKSSPVSNSSKTCDCVNNTVKNGEASCEICYSQDIFPSVAEIDCTKNAESSFESSLTDTKEPHFTSKQKLCKDCESDSKVCIQTNRLSDSSAIEVLHSNQNVLGKEIRSDKQIYRRTSTPKTDRSKLCKFAPDDLDEESQLSMLLILPSSTPLRHYQPSLLSSPDIFQPEESTDFTNTIVNGRDQRNFVKNGKEILLASSFVHKQNGVDNTRNIQYLGPTSEATVLVNSQNMIEDNTNPHCLESRLSRKRGHPKFLFMDEESERKTSIDDFLADVFSSPDTEARQRRSPPNSCKKQRLSIQLHSKQSAHGNRLKQESSVKSVCGTEGVKSACQTNDLRVCSSQFSKLVTTSTKSGESIVVNHLLPCVDNKSVECLLKLSENAKKFQNECPSHDFGTPPSILKSGRKMQTSSSVKRVRFSLECDPSSHSDPGGDSWLVKRSLTLKSKGQMFSILKHRSGTDTVNTWKADDVGKTENLSCASTTDLSSVFLAPDAEKTKHALNMMFDNVSAKEAEDEFSQLSFTCLQEMCSVMNSCEDSLTVQQTHNQEPFLSRVGEKTCNVQENEMNNLVLAEEKITEQFHKSDTEGNLNLSVAEVVAADGGDTDLFTLSVCDEKIRKVGFYEEISKDASSNENVLNRKDTCRKIAEDTHRGKVLEEDFSEKSIERRHLAETNIPEVQTDVHMGTKHVASEGKKVSDIDKEIENTDSVMEMCKHSANFVEKVSDIDKETKHTAHLVEKVSGGDNETKHKTIAAEVAQHRIHPKVCLSLKKGKKFLYPSSSQIRNTCPENVYSFASFKPLSMENARLPLLKTKDAADCTSVVIHGSIAREQQTATGTDVSACGKQVDLGTNRKNRDEESRSSQAGEMLESASGSLERIALSGKPLVVSGNVLIQEGDPDWAEFEDEMNWSNSEDCLTDDGEHAVVDLSRSEIEEDERLMCGIGSETKDERLVCNISSKADKRWTSGGATVIVEMQLNFEADALSVTGPPCAGITPELVMETNMDDTDMDNINTVEDVHMEGAAIDSMIDVKDVDTSNSVVGPLLHDTESSFKKNLASEEGKDDLSFALECLDEREFFPQIMKEVSEKNVDNTEIRETQQSPIARFMCNRHKISELLTSGHIVTKAQNNSKISGLSDQGQCIGKYGDNSYCTTSSPAISVRFTTADAERVCDSASLLSCMDKECLGFSSASGKKIVLSAEALNKAQTLFRNETDSKYLESDLLTDTSDDRLGQGVATDKEASSLILASRTAVVDLAAMKSLSADGESGAACPTQTSPSSEAEVTTINTPKGTVDVAPAAIGEMQQADMKVMAEPHMFQENTNAGNKLGKTLGNFYDDAAVVPVESKALGMRELGQEWSQTSLNNSDTGAEMGSAELDFDAGQSDAKLHETVSSEPFIDDRKTTIEQNKNSRGEAEIYRKLESSLPALSDESVNTNLSTDMSSDTGGFATAEGKPITLSAKAKEKAVALWKAVEKEISGEESAFGYGGDGELSSVKQKVSEKKLLIFGEKDNRMLNMGRENSVLLAVGCDGPSRHEEHTVPVDAEVFRHKGFRPFKSPLLIKKTAKNNRQKDKTLEKPKLEGTPIIIVDTEGDESKKIIPDKGNTAMHQETDFHHPPSSVFPAAEGSSVINAHSMKMPSDDYFDEDEGWGLMQGELLLDTHETQNIANINVTERDNSRKPKEQSLLSRSFLLETGHNECSPKKQGQCSYTEPADDGLTSKARDSCCSGALSTRDSLDQKQLITKIEAHNQSYPVKCIGTNMTLKTNGKDTQENCKEPQSSQSKSDCKPAGFSACSLDPNKQIETEFSELVSDNIDRQGMYEEFSDEALLEAFSDEPFDLVRREDCSFVLEGEPCMRHDKLQEFNESCFLQTAPDKNTECLPTDMMVDLYSVGAKEMIDDLLSQKCVSDVQMEDSCLMDDKEEDTELGLMEHDVTNVNVAENQSLASQVELMDRVFVESPGRPEEDCEPVLPCLEDVSDKIRQLHQSTSKKSSMVLVNNLNNLEKRVSASGDGNSVNSESNHQPSNDQEGSENSDASPADYLSDLSWSNFTGESHNSQLEDQDNQKREMSGPEKHMHTQANLVTAESTELLTQTTQNISQPVSVQLLPEFGQNVEDKVSEVPNGNELCCKFQGSNHVGTAKISLSVHEFQDKMFSSKPYCDSSKNFLLAEQSMMEHISSNQNNVTRPSKAENEIDFLSLCHRTSSLSFMRDSMTCQTAEKMSDFFTASRISTLVSKSALEKSKDILDVDVTCKNENHCRQESSGREVKDNEAMEVVSSIRKNMLANGAQDKEAPATSFLFQTAKGKPVKVSRKSVAMASVLLDVGEMEMDRSSEENSHPAAIFYSCTTSGVLRSGVESTQKYEVQEKQTGIAASSIQEKEQFHSFGGFCTASGSKVSVNEKSLHHGRKLLESLEDGARNAYGIRAVEAVINISEDIGNSALHTASTDFYKSKVSLKCRKNLSCETRNCSEVLSSGMLSMENSSEFSCASFQGFKTAKGTVVNVLEKSLIDATKLLTAADNEASLGSDDLTNLTDVWTPVNPAKGFHVDGGKKGTVSKKVFQGDSAESEGGDEKMGADLHVVVTTEVQSLSEAGCLSNLHHEEGLSGLGDETVGRCFDGCHDTEASDSKLVSHLLEEENVGFQTAKGKLITSCSEGLNQALKLFDSVSKDNRKDSENLWHQTGNLELCSGTKADPKQGKDVNDYEASVSTHTEFIAGQYEPFSIKRPAGTGFQTAQSKPLTVSKSSLVQVQELVVSSDAPSLLKHSKDIQNSSMCIHFRTGAGIQMKVSEKALEHARKVLESSNDQQRALQDEETETVPTGVSDMEFSFHTAKGASVGVSKKSLEHAQQLLLSVDNLSSFADQQSNIAHTGSVKKNLQVVSSPNASCQRSYISNYDENIPLVSKEKGSLTVETANHNEQQVELSTLQRDSRICEDGHTNEGVVMVSKCHDSRSELDEREGGDLHSSGPHGQQPQNPRHKNAMEKVSTSSVQLVTEVTEKRLLCKDAKDSPDNSGTMKRASSSQKPNFQPPFKKAKFVPPSTTKKNQTLDLSHEKHCYEISRDQPSLQNDKMSSNIHLREEEFSTSSLTFATPDSLEEARLHQEKIIRHKKRQKVKPVKGKWLTLKQMQKQIKLRDLYLNPKGLSSHELIHAGVSSTVLGVSSHTAEEYRFFLPAFYPNASTGILVGDNALLVCDAFGYAGKEEFYRAFLTVDGVDPNLISQAWVYNHYRWVVWKTAAYEVALPRVFASRALTPDIVMMQLKYRYDREVDACHRSALKKIVERDDTACKRLVLCISDIRLQKEDETVMMEVTDGWYRIWAKPDPALQQLIDRKKIKIGRKIITTGAELAGSHDSCSPLEIPTGLYLKLWGNSTRPAPYWSRLGYQPCPASLCVPLSSVVADGGLVGCIDVVVVRKYPIMFMEKQADGSCVFRNAEMEDRARRCYEQQKEGAMERLCAKLQVEMEREDATAKAKRKRHSLGSREIKALTTGAELCEVLDGESHPEELQAMLTATQRDQVWEHRQRQQEERQAQFKYRLERAWNESTTQGERIVSPVQKLLVAGCCRHDVDKKTSALLTVWRPGSDWEVVSEGQRYCIFSLTASSRTRQSRHGIQLTAGRQVRLQNKPVDENLLGLVYEPREVWSVSDLQQRKPLYNEIDFTGRVSDIVSTKPGSDRIHAVDSNGQLITVWFWGGLQAFGLQNFFKKGLAFSGFNLYVRNSGQDRVEVTAFPETSYFTVTSRFTDHYSDKHRKLSSGEHPDNSEDTATSVGQFSESPETKQRKAVQKQKLFRLQSYGKPPPLTPLPNCMSPAAAKGFKPVKMRNDKMLP
ncbi:uncharacterized protein LOC112575292 isoform X3 [Pomacea canaliculata]|uniref:uncharacterized protein LOC112575292 isoform X3 n=1 Tax=Pomacea canaliculata TaxID=400727 RepID=UPI000D72F25E|nr:uncharacterized protein LOC112575292 isoform X3 [Pomacea canaliculata]